MKEITKKYTNGEVTIVWKPSICIHSAICFHSMPEVFDPRERPWVKPENKDTKNIIEQVKQCPSGALSYYMNDTNNNSAMPEQVSETKVKVNLNGPLLVYGNLSITDSNGDEIKKENATAFCRCGASKKKPFCDGSHKTIDPFDI